MSKFYATYHISAKHSLANYCFNNEPVKVYIDDCGYSDQHGMFFANHGKLGCSKMYRTPERAAQAMFIDNACDDVRILGYSPVPTTERSVIALAKPDNPADMEITLRISGNRLIRLLGAADSLIYREGNYHFAEDGNTIVVHDSCLRELHDLVEVVRDELSAQRNNTTAEDVYANRVRTGR